MVPCPAGTRLPKMTYVAQPIRGYKKKANINKTPQELQSKPMGKLMTDAMQNLMTKRK